MGSAKGKTDMINGFNQDAKEKNMVFSSKTGQIQELGFNKDT